jgi:hypothetical protein
VLVTLRRSRKAQKICANSCELLAHYYSRKFKRESQTGTTSQHQRLAVTAQAGTMIRQVIATPHALVVVLGVVMVTSLGRHEVVAGACESG